MKNPVFSSTISLVLILYLIPTPLHAEAERTLDGQIKFPAIGDSITAEKIVIPSRKIKTGWFSADYEPYSATVTICISGVSQATVVMCTYDAYTAFRSGDTDEYRQGILFSLTASQDCGYERRLGTLPEGSYVLLIEREAGLLEELGASGKNSVKNTKRWIRDKLNDSLIDKMKNKANDFIEDWEESSKKGILTWKVELTHTE